MRLKNKRATDQLFADRKLAAAESDAAVAIDRAKEARETLALLLHFEPSLTAYRRTVWTAWGDEEVWDLEGMRKAKEAHQVFADAEKYDAPAPPREDKARK